jgi:hypothetical protein
MYVNQTHGITVSGRKALFGVVELLEVAGSAYPPGGLRKRKFSEGADRAQKRLVASASSGKSITANHLRDSVSWYDRAGVALFCQLL